MSYTVNKESDDSSSAASTTPVVKKASKSKQKKKSLETWLNQLFKLEDVLSSSSSQVTLADIKPFVTFIGQVQRFTVPENVPLAMQIMQNYVELLLHFYDLYNDHHHQPTKWDIISRAIKHFRKKNNRRVELEGEQAKLACAFLLDMSIAKRTQEDNQMK